MDSRWRRRFRSRSFLRTLSTPRRSAGPVRPQRPRPWGRVTRPHRRLRPSCLLVLCFLFFCLSVCLFAGLFACLFVYWFACCLFLFVCILFVCLFVCLFVVFFFLFVCCFVCLFVCLLFVCLVSCLFVCLLFFFSLFGCSVGFAPPACLFVCLFAVCFCLKFHAFCFLPPTSVRK